MTITSEAEAYTAGYLAAKSRLSDSTTLSADEKFLSVLSDLKAKLKEKGVESVLGNKGGKVSLRLAKIPTGWSEGIPDMDERMQFAFIRGAFEANGCFTTSTKREGDKTYVYERIQYYYREGEEELASFIRDCWLQWLGNLGMNQGRKMATTLIPKGQSNRTKDTYQFAVSGKRKDIVENYMYFKATISLERIDLIDGG